MVILFIAYAVIDDKVLFLANVDEKFPNKLQFAIPSSDTLNLKSTKDN